MNQAAGADSSTEKKPLFGVTKKDDTEKKAFAGFGPKPAESKPAETKLNDTGKSLFGNKKADTSNPSEAKPEGEKKPFLGTSNPLKPASAGSTEGSKTSPFGAPKSSESSIKDPNVEKVVGAKPFLTGGKITKLNWLKIKP